MVLFETRTRFTRTLRGYRGIPTHTYNRIELQICLYVQSVAILFLCTMGQLIHFLFVYSEFRYVFELYSVEIYAISHNSFDICLLD
jgi:hypothetical protein